MDSVNGSVIPQFLLQRVFFCEKVVDSCFSNHPFTFYEKIEYLWYGVMNGQSSAQPVCLQLYLFHRDYGLINL